MACTNFNRSQNLKSMWKFYCGNIQVITVFKYLKQAVLSYVKKLERWDCGILSFCTFCTEISMCSLYSMISYKTYFYWSQNMKAYGKFTV